jgi:hypothetical protein
VKTETAAQYSPLLIIFIENNKKESTYLVITCFGRWGLRVGGGGKE